MKRFLQLCSIILCIFLLVTPVSANSSYSELYISITDALINTKQGNDTEAKQAIENFTSMWEQISTEETEAKAVVDEALKNVQNAKDNQELQTALSNLSKALSALEKLENPVDEQKEREEFNRKFSPYMTAFEEALQSKDLEAINNAYNQLNVKWNQYEAPVRAQSIGLYGQIETQLSFIRISLTADQPDLDSIASQYETFKKSIEQFVAGEQVAAVEGDFSLETLIDFLTNAQDFINSGEFLKASDELKQFIVTWPNVEMEVSTRNGSLYTKIESEMPILASELMKETPNVGKVLEDISYFITEISLIQENSNYSFWDSALILLREGLEALLIILVLVSFLKKSNQEKMEKWIYAGACAGVLLSIVAAILLSVLFNSLSANTNREMLEGYVGLIAAGLMIAVGIWLHNKSSVKAWNAYISKQMGHAISKQSVFAMAAISFLSVFREGAETIIFYVGIAPNMPTLDFVLGIAVAIVILVIVGFVMFKLSLKIPVHKFFFVATILIYILAFKIIGTSIHTLQLTNVLPTSVLHQLPVFSEIGFYPTIETIIAQVLLIIMIIAVSLYQARAHQ